MSLIGSTDVTNRRISSLQDLPTAPLAVAETVAPARADRAALAGDEYAPATRALPQEGAGGLRTSGTRSLAQGPIAAYMSGRFTGAQSEKPAGPRPLVPGVLSELADLVAPGADRAEVEAALTLLGPMTWALQVPVDLPEAHLRAGGKYLVDGVPAVVNQVLRGDVEAARADGLTWSFLGEGRSEWVQSFKDLFAFATSVTVDRPKAVFHATARQFTEGQTIGAYLSMTESPAFAAKYVPHATEQRRVVTFVLDGSSLAPGRAGLVRNRGWNEVLLPPDSYTVARMEKTAAGEVVHLRPSTTPIEEARQAYGDRVDAIVPETVSDLC